MDSLSSCYFCGVALDEPLDEYPVVPAQFRDDGPGTTATLCPACHRKLETVLDAVVEAADANGGTSLEAADADSRGQDAAVDAPSGAESVSPAQSTPDADPDEPEPDDESETGTESDGPEPPEGGVGVTDPDDVLTDPDDGSLLDAGETGPEEPDDEARTTADDQAEPAEEDDEETVTAEDIEEMAGDIDPGMISDDDADDGDGEDVIRDAMEPDVPAELQPGSDDGGLGTDAGDEKMDDEAADPAEEGIRAAETTDDIDETTDADETADDAAEPTDTDEPTDAAEPTDADETRDDASGEERVSDESDGQETDADDEPPTARTTVSALEYNKVMRLLQNREFPLDRAEIETVAANAYGLAQSECAEVIDLAIDRGLIDEENGKLVRPE